MKTIQTKYLAPTETQGARIKAYGGEMTAVIDYDYGMVDEELHATAVQKLNEKLKWSGRLISGHTDTGYVWVLDNGYDIDIYSE